MMPLEPLATLAAFRRDLHRGFERRADALFELTDALLIAAPIAIWSLPWTRQVVRLIA